MFSEDLKIIYVLDQYRSFYSVESDIKVLLVFF